MSNNITILSEQEIFDMQFTMYGNIDDPLFLAKDVAEWIENKNVSQMLNIVDDDEKVIYNVYTLGGNQDAWFLTEDGLYEVLMHSRKPVAKAFKKEVKSILKQLRKTGAVITESATQEAIDFESKYGIRRIRKTFRETTDVIATWEEYKALSKAERDAHRIDNAERIKRANIIIDELQDYIANNALDMKQYELPIYQGLMLEIRQTTQKWSNKMYGGKISNQTRKLNNLSQQNEELKQQIDQLTPPERNWVTLPYHPFSENYQYDRSYHVTPAYSGWRRRFPRNLVPSREDYETYENVDFTKPICMEIQYINMPRFDTANLHKSLLDMIFNDILGIDDNIVTKIIPETVGHCDNYSDGQISFCIYNI